MPDLWPYVPLPDVSETLAWSTDVVRADSAEMRYALHSGMQYLTYAYQMDSRFQEVSARFKSNPLGAWHVPLWHQSSKAGAVLSTDTALNVDVNADWTDYAVVFGGCDDFVIVQIDSVTSTLNLTAPVGAAFTNPTVAPIRTCYPISGASADRLTRKHSAFAIEWLSSEAFSQSGSGYATIGGLPFFACASAIMTPLSGTIEQPAEMFVSGFGGFELVPARSVLDHRYEIKIAHSDTAEKQAFRRFLGDLRGRDGEFFMADWEGKIDLTASLPIGALTASFTAIAADVASYVGRFVQIGDELREITASADLGGGVHQISFDALTAAASTAKFLRKMRLDVDEVDFLHLRGGVSRATLNALEVS